MAFIPNPGRLPEQCAVLSENGEVVSYRRVHVVLRCGYATKGREPNGWASEGRSACRWTIQNHPYDIMEFEVI